MRLSKTRLARQVANDNEDLDAPAAAPSLMRDRLKRGGDIAGEWIADAFVVGGVFLLLVSAGWL
jgi:hypothetical protein